MYNKTVAACEARAGCCTWGALQLCCLQRRSLSAGRAVDLIPGRRRWWSRHGVRLLTAAQQARHVTEAAGGKGKKCFAPLFCAAAKAQLDQNASHPQHHQNNTPERYPSGQYVSGSLRVYQFLTRSPNSSKAVCSGKQQQRHCIPADNSQQQAPTVAEPRCLKRDPLPAMV